VVHDDDLIGQVFYLPTVPHCSLATLIGLSIRYKLQQHFCEPMSKIDLLIEPGSHNTEKEINKQVNDKERCCAALENPPLVDMIRKLTQSSEAHRH
jgi:hypothetical protein